MGEQIASSAVLMELTHEHVMNRCATAIISSEKTMLLLPQLQVPFDGSTAQYVL